MCHELYYSRRTAAKQTHKAEPEVEPVKAPEPKVRAPEKVLEPAE